MTATAGIDAKLFEKVNGLAGKSPGLDAVMVAFAKYSPLLVVITLAVLWLRWRRDSQRAAAIAAASALVALGIGQLLGKAFPRLRPSDVLPTRLLIPHSADTSFPSDHATLLFAIAVALWFWNRRLGAFALVVACITALSRVWVGAHYPGDVLGGAILGSACAFAICRLSESSRVSRAIDSVFDALHRVKLAAGRDRTR